MKEKPAICNNMDDPWGYYAKWNKSEKDKYCMMSLIQTYFRDIARFIPDHHNKLNITITQVTGMFWFPSAYKNYVYTLL